MNARHYAYITRGMFRNEITSFRLEILVIERDPPRCALLASGIGEQEVFTVTPDDLASQMRMRGAFRCALGRWFYTVNKANYALWIDRARLYHCRHVAPPDDAHSHIRVAREFLSKIGTASGAATALALAGWRCAPQTQHNPPHAAPDEPVPMRH